MSETWPVQNENTSIQYPVWFSNTEVSVSVSNLKNTEEVSVSVCQKNWSISIQYQYPLCKKNMKKQAHQADLKNWGEIRFLLKRH